MHPKKPTDVLSITAACKNHVHIYLHQSLQSHSRRSKELQEFTSDSRKPMAKLAFSTDITFENFQENHVRKQIKPTRHHHVLFFCAKRPTDNSCIESYARRNNKNLCISKSLVFTYSTSKLSPVTCLTTCLSEGCQVWMWKCKKVVNPHFSLLFFKVNLYCKMCVHWAVYGVLEEEDPGISRWKQQTKHQTKSRRICLLRKSLKLEYLFGMDVPSCSLYVTTSVQWDIKAYSAYLW